MESSKIISTQIDRFLGVYVYLLMDECVSVVREFSKEEVVMAETRRMAEEAKRFGEEVQEGAQRFGREYQRAAETGFEAASRSFTEANQGFQAIAAEMMQYSKAAFDDATHTWKQLIGVRSLEQAVQIQSDYAKRVYENHLAEMSKLGEMYAGMVRDASKPVEEASRRFR
jgi:phasin family protein